MKEKTSDTTTNEILVPGKLHKAQLYIESRYKDLDKPKKKKTFHPCITISRETGAGAKSVCDHLLKYIEQKKLFTSQQWAFFDQNLIEEVLKHHNLPNRLAELMSEEKYFHIKTIITDLLSNQPGPWILIHKTSETILQLAEVGNSIIVGRGGCIITSKLKNTIHIRLVAKLSDRIKKIQSIYNMSRHQAEEYISKKDSDRKKYIKTYFNRDITDPKLYHLILNTSKITYNHAAEVIGQLTEIYFNKYLTQFS